MAVGSRLVAGLAVRDSVAGDEVSVFHGGEPTDQQLVAGEVQGGNPHRHARQQDWREARKEMVYLTTHSTHFIYGYMVKEHSYSKERKWFI